MQQQILPNNNGGNKGTQITLKINKAVYNHTLIVIHKYVLESMIDFILKGLFT